MAEKGPPTAVTVLDRPQSTRPEPAKPATATQTLATPEQAMRAFEARRAFVLAVGITILATVTIGLVLFLGGDRRAQLVHGDALAITGCTAGAYAVFARNNPETYKSWRAAVVAYICITTGATGYYYWGVYSAFASVVPIVIYLFVSGQSLRAALIGVALVIAIHVGLAAAQLAGWIDAIGLVRVIPGFSTLQYVVVIVVLQCVVLGAMFAGIDARRTMRKVLDDHHEALRAIAQRDALLAEAHAEVRAARAPGEGRYTG